MIPHDAPSAQEMLAAVREWMENDVLASTEGRLNFHTRVAINVLAMVERELELGPEQAAAHAERLAALGFEDDRALAAAIRSGAIDDDPTLAVQVRAEVLASVIDKLRVANPKYLSDGRG
ncbi:MAG: hypothetical protein JWN62_1728 [Acidimicrobiales bacterium]|nr:hypothetical protein [Acidimicrobiales bacterium]